MLQLLFSTGSYRKQQSAATIELHWHLKRIIKLLEVRLEMCIASISKGLQCANMLHYLVHVFSVLKNMV